MKKISLHTITNVALCLLLVYIGFIKDISLTFSIGNPKVVEQTDTTTMLQEVVEEGPVATESKPIVKKIAKKTRKPSKTQAAYIKRFSNVAQTEMQKYGIPASITLAQGLLESNAGQSPLAKKHNNHFGIKCFSKKCPAGHCGNYTDDSHKDFFRTYQTAWESFRAHSKLLTYKRYKHLTRYGNQYKLWAEGLKTAGYATSKTYDKDLIRLIEDFELYKFDKV